jgi:hypothetical protein
MLKNWFEKNRNFQNILNDSSFFSKNFFWKFYFLKNSSFLKMILFVPKLPRSYDIYLLFKKWFNTFKFNFSKFHKLEVQFSTVSTNINNSFFFFLQGLFENCFVSNINHKQFLFFLFLTSVSQPGQEKKKVVRGTKGNKNEPTSSH